MSHGSTRDFLLFQNSRDRWIFLLEEESLEVQRRVNVQHSHVQRSPKQVIKVFPSLPVVPFAPILPRESLISLQVDTCSFARPAPLKPTRHRDIYHIWVRYINLRRPTLRIKLQLHFRGLACVSFRLRIS